MNRHKYLRIQRAVLLFFLVLCWFASMSFGENPSSFFETKKLEQKSFVDLHKLDPVLKRFILDQEAMTAPGALSLSAPPMIQQRNPGSISAIIKVSGNAMAIESSGARVRTVIGEFATADIPFGSLNRLIQLPNVIYVQASRLMEPTFLDVSVPGTGAHQVWNSSPGYTGKGVIVGVIDSGIDWSHPDFMGEDGTSRILYIWDQCGAGEQRVPAGYDYGVEWTKADIDSGLCEEMDPSGHGTHVSSTIAGNGRDMHGFTGMAPDADIIVVKTSFGDAEILDGTDYIFRKASELNRPVVVNMSFGSQWGPHDGTSLMDQAISALLPGGPGETIVAAAGNEGGMPVHVGAVLRQPAGGNYPWTAVQTFAGTESIVIQIWYDSPDPLSVRVLLPENDRGDLADLGMGWVSEGQLRVSSVPRGPIAGAEVDIEAQPLALYPNRKGIYIYISSNGDLTIPIDEYIYAIEYDGPGIALDVYAVWRGYFEWASRLPASVSLPNKSFLLEGDGGNTIISPASASEVICVGSYVSKSEWIDSENRIRTDESLRIGNISVFSSLGPLLNGARKPDIAAPGEMVVAAFSDDAWERSSRIYRDGRHASMRGTSMASPHVTGAVALMYQQNPNLTASEAKYILTRSATDRGTAGWDKAWGYGALNVLAAMNIPSEPRVLRATAGDGSITVEWSPNKESDIAGYRIYARLDTGYWMLDTGYWMPDVGYWTPDAGCWILDAGYWILDAGCWMLESSIEYGASGIEYRVSGMQNGLPISLSISAYNSAGNEGPKSQEISIIPSAPGPDVTPPDPPGDLTAVPIDSAVDLTWSPNREYDLSGYRIYYGTSTGNYSQVQRVGKVSSYRLNGLTNGVRVYISASAIDTSGNESKRASEVSALPRLFTLSSLRYQGGWPVLMRHDVHSSPTLYDVDGDGRLEVSISAKDGRIHLLRYDGSSMRGWPISTGLASISSPALADVDGDGSVEVVVGAGDSVYMWSDLGTPVRGWPVSTLGKVTASPALGDIDDDGGMEVVVGSRDGILYAYNSDGSTVNGWPVITHGYIHSSAALADIDGDSRIEIVVGSGDGYLHVFRGDGTTTDGWPVYVRSEIVSSPAVGDIDGDGSMEIVVADKSGWVHAWHHNSKTVEGWPVDLKDDIVSSPALGDIDDNESTLEIVIGTEYGSIYVLKSDGTIMDGWPVSVADDMTSSPAIGDMNGDGSADVVVATGTGLGYTGLVYAFSSSGRKIGTLWPVHTEGNIRYSSPALGDIDGDGDVELVVGSCRDAAGAGGYLHAWDISGRSGDDGIVWGGFRHDSRHTGVADDKIPPSFVIALIQNPALKKHLNLYAISSEKLIAGPELTVEVTYSGANEKTFIQSKILTQFDASSNIYYASLVLEQDGMYDFTVSGTDASGNTGSSSKIVSIPPISPSPHPSIPPTFSLLPNYPNPFNPGTWIPYELAQTSDVTIEIYSSAGQLIRSLALGRRAAGSYTVVEDAAYWDGTDNLAQDVASGIYFYVLRAGSFEACRKMILLR